MIQVYFNPVTGMFEAFANGIQLDVNAIELKTNNEDFLTRAVITCFVEVVNQKPK